MSGAKGSIWTAVRFCSILIATSIAHAEETVSPIFVSAGEALLIEVIEKNHDLSIDVKDGDNIYTIDRRNGRADREVILLGPHPSSRYVTLTISALLDQLIDSRNYDIEVTNIDPQSEKFNTLKKISEAGKHASSNDKESLDKAITLYIEAANSSLINNPGLATEALLLAASIQYQIFDLESALETLSSISISMCQTLRNCYKKSWISSLVAFKQDRYFEAVVGLNNTLEALGGSNPAIENTADRANIMSDLGLALMFAKARQTEQQQFYIESNFSQHSEIDFLDDSLSFANEIQNQYLIGKAHANLGGYYFHDQDDPITATSHLEKAATVFSEIHNNGHLIESLCNLALTYMVLGEYDRAQSVMHQAIGKLDSIFNPSLPRESFNILSRIYLSLGDYQRAEHFARQTIDYDISSSRSQRLYGAKTLLGQILRSKGDVNEAVRLHSEVLDYYISTNQDRRVASILYQLGIDFLEIGDSANARSSFKKSESRDNYGKILLSRPEGIMHWAKLLILENRYQQVIDFLMATRSTSLRRDHAFATKIEISQLLMRAYNQLGDYSRAIRYGNQAVDLINDIQGQLEFFRLGPAWAAQTASIFDEFTNILLIQHSETNNASFAEQAFLIIEQSRVTSFMQQRLSSSEIQEDLEPDEENQLRRQLNQLSRKRTSTDQNNPEYELISQNYFRTLELYQARHLLRGVNTPLEEHTIQELIDKVPDESAVIEYLCIPTGNCHAFVIADGKLNTFTLATYDEIFTLATEAHSDLSSRSIQSSAALNALSKIILEQIIPKDVSHLYIATDYPISTLPLAAFQTEGENEKKSILESHSISIIPSLRAFSTSESLNSFEYELVVIADPIFSNLAIENTDLSTESYRGWVDNLPELPWSAREAKNLENIYFAQNIKIHTREEATRKNLLSEQTRNSKIIHIASHAYFDQHKPDLVGIALSSETIVNEAEANGDFLSVNELLAKQFNSDLVVISGCETALGEYQGGEGAMSMARAFLAQGVNHVISTLWPVSDRASSIFMREFHTALQASSGNYASALKNAQLQLSKHPTYSAAFYWAGYTLTSVH